MDIPNILKNFILTTLLGCIENIDEIQAIKQFVKFSDELCALTLYTAPFPATANRMI